MPNRRASQAESKASVLLSELGMRHSFPVEVDKIASELGIYVQRDSFESDDVSGLLLREPDQVPVIVVNAGHGRARQRFTVAHEIGHFALHEGKRIVLDRAVRVNFRDAASGLANDLEEIEANAFAAGLLMPADLVRAEVDRLINGKACSDGELVEKLTRQFQVSRSAMEYRLINLGLLSPG